MDATAADRPAPSDSRGLRPSPTATPAPPLSSVAAPAPVPVPTASSSASASSAAASASSSSSSASASSALKRRRLPRTPAARTLVAFLRALVGLTVTVELRNETAVRGTLLSVEPNMNLELSGVRWKAVQRQPQRFERVFVLGKVVRYVHIPDTVDVNRVMDDHAKKMAKLMNQYKRPKRIVDA